MDFIRFKCLSNYIFKKIIKNNQIWSQIFEDTLSVNIKSKNSGKYFKEIYDQSLAVFKAIKIKNGRAYKTTTFDVSTREYMILEYGKYSFFP